MENQEEENKEVESIDDYDNDDVPIETQIESPPKNTLSLQLGDIIEIIAPTNEDIHQMTALITYIDDEKIKLIDVATAKYYKISLLENGQISDESITKIQLMNRADENGYARQNHLLPNTWVSIHFGGDAPSIIHGEISNLEEDMIEVITYPEMTVIYIDFGYKGLPETIPIESIVIRDKPASLKKGSLALLKQSIDMGETYEEEQDEEPTMEFTETGESIISIPENAETEEDIFETLEELYIEAKDIFKGEKLGKITQLVEIPEWEKRYGIDEQVNDFMDELLSTIPNNQRTQLVMNSIHTVLTRFKELRYQFSKFDDNKNVYDIQTIGAYYKPLIPHIQKLDKKIQWLIPIVKNRAVVYDINNTLEADDVFPLTFRDNIKEISELQTEYMKNKSGNPHLDYDTLNKRMDALFASFKSSPMIREKALDNVSVLANLDAIIDNLGDYYSSVYSESGIKSQQYVVRRYNLGSSKLGESVMKTGKSVFIRTPMTNNDTMTLKSILMLPESVVRHSAIDGQSSSILEKANLHTNMFSLYRALRKRTNIITHTVDDFSKEFDYENDAGKQFLQGIHEFTLDETLLYEEERMQKFLEVIVPKTRFLIRLVKKYINDKFTYMDVLKQLEPFMVYSSHITYKQYMEIRYLIKERIREFVKTFGNRYKDFSELKNVKYDVNTKPSPILSPLSKTLTDKKDYSDIFFQSYQFLTEEKEKSSLSSQEILYKLLQTDNANLYNNIIASIMIVLMTPSNMMDAITNIDDTTELEKIKPKECHLRYLAKKYDSISGLQKDNNAETLYFDKEYDDTPYELLSKYAAQQKQMNPELFIEFLTENLIHKHECPKESAKNTAIALISKKKMVEDGNYAVLEIKPQLPKDVDASKLTEEEKKEIEREGYIRKKTYFYRRKNNYWIKDNEINEDAFIDTNTLFCNISEKCFKNTSSIKTCETTDDATERFKAISRKKLLAEFDKRYEINADELEKNLENNIAYYLKIISKNNILKEIQSHKANYLANELGKQVAKPDTIESPFLKLRDMILGQDDFTKKQFDICRFVEKFCREPMVNELQENAYWKYCLKTNMKLMPASLFELAQTFINGGNYAMKQQELCAKCGKLSDDGDSWIDEHSGFILRKIDYSTEEGYDEAGYRMQTHEILEKDLGVAVMEAIQKKEKPVFESETAESIYNIFSSICTEINIPTDAIAEMVLRITNEIFNKTLISEASYAKRVALAEKKNKKISSYKDYKNQNLILITCCVLIVAIQTATPSFKTTKSFPGCVRSFSGYPLNGIEDTTGIKYIACVLYKMRSKISVWESISKINAETLSKRIEEILKTYVITRDDVDDMYLKKRQYMELYPELVSIQEHNISKWHHFLPPVVPLDNIKSLKNVGSDFKNDFMELLRKGSTDQFQYHNVLKSKVSRFGFGIIEAINHIVRDKDAVLKTSSRHPFLENACCNDSVFVVPLSYFHNEDNNIGLYIRSTKSLIELMQDVKLLSKASMFYHPSFTGIRYPVASSGYDDENIYGAVIKYCNFDRDLPVPEKLTVICQERPLNYVRTWNIVEKMEFLKKNGKRYNAADLKHLMSIVNRENIIKVTETREFSRLDSWKDIIQNFDTTNSTVVEEPLRKLLNTVFDKYNPKIMSDKLNDETKALKNYLIKTNRKLYTDIMSFFDKHGNLSNTEYNNLAEFLSNVEVSNADTNRSETYYDSGLHSVTQHIKNMVYSMSKVYPSLLSYDGDIYKEVHKHWGLSDKHALDIEKFIDKYYNQIEKFKQDSVLLRLLKEIDVRLVDLNLFVQNIPIHTEITKKINDEDGIRDVIYHSLFDKQTTYLLLVYSFYSVIHEYMNCSYDADLLQLDIQERKHERRGKINRDKDVSNSLESVDFGDFDDDVLNDEENKREIDIITGNTKELQERTCNLLYVFLDIEKENKKTTNMSYADIMKFVNRSKEKEKREIIKYLGDMSIEERKIEDMFKNYRLGRWNVGQQTGLYKYDQATYDRERNELMMKMAGEIESGGMDVVTEKAVDIYEIEKQEKADIENFYEEEAYNIQGLGENYMDGGYYSEDQEYDE